MLSNTKYYLWRFLHNAIIHPLIGVFGEREWVMRLHESTGNKWRSDVDKLQLQDADEWGIGVISGSHNPRTSSENLNEIVVTDSHGNRQRGRTIYEPYPYSNSGFHKVEVGNYVIKLSGEGKLQALRVVEIDLKTLVASVEVLDAPFPNFLKKAAYYFWEQARGNYQDV